MDSSSTFHELLVYFWCAKKCMTDPGLFSFRNKESKWNTCLHPRFNHLCNVLGAFRGVFDLWDVIISREIVHLKDFPLSWSIMPNNISFSEGPNNILQEQRTYSGDGVVMGEAQRKAMLDKIRRNKAVGISPRCSGISVIYWISCSMLLKRASL